MPFGTGVGFPCSSHAHAPTLAVVADGASVSVVGDNNSVVAATTTYGAGGVVLVETVLICACTSCKAAIAAEVSPLACKSLMIWSS